MRLTTSLGVTGLSMLLGLVGPEGGAPAAAAPPSLPSGGVVKISASGSGFDVTTKYGTGAVSPSVPCSVKPGAQTGRWTVACGRINATMTGTINATSANLMSVDDIDLGALANDFPEPIFKPIELLVKVAPLKAVKLGLTSGGGLYVHGTIDLSKIAETNEVGFALAQINGMLTHYAAGGLSAASPAFDLYPSFVETIPRVELRVPIVDTCAGSDAIGVTKTGFKFKKAALVFSFAPAPKPEIAAKIEGGAYIRPTGLDEWLYFSPNATFAVKAKETRVSVGGTLTGACPRTCANICNCDIKQCTGDWHPLGLPPLTFNGGKVTIGMSSLSPEIPIIDAGLSGKLGSSKTTAGLRLDVPGKVFALYAQAEHLTLGDAVRAVSPVSTPKFLDALGVKAPELSLAVAATPGNSVTVNDHAVPLGFAVRGSVGDDSIGIIGTIDFSQSVTGAFDLWKNLVTKGDKVTTIAAMAGVPNATLNVLLDASGLEQKVLAKLPAQARYIIGETFLIEKIGFGVSTGSTTGIEVKLAFKALGMSQSIDVSAQTDPYAIVEQIAKKLEAVAVDVGNLIASQTAAFAKSVWTDIGQLVSECGTVHTVNNTDHRAWITIYNKVLDSHTDWGWLEPHSTRSWKSGTYMCGTYYKVRAEVVRPGSDKDVIFDTNKTWNQSFGENKYCLLQGANNYYWSSGGDCVDRPKLAPLTRGTTIAIYSPTWKRVVRADAPSRVASSVAMNPPKPSEIGELDQLKVIDAGNGMVALYAVRKGYFVGVHGNALASKGAHNESLPSDWGDERFLAIDDGDGTTAFYNPVSHVFLRMRSDGGMDASKSSMPAIPGGSTQERFKVIYR